MFVWLILISVSLVIGWAFGQTVKGVKGGVLSLLVPWFLLLAALLLNEYVLPYSGGGASVWPIAQLFGGTAAAGLGLISFLITTKLKSNSDEKPH